MKENLNVREILVSDALRENGADARVVFASLPEAALLPDGEEYATIFVRRNPPTQEEERVAAIQREIDEKAQNKNPFDWDKS